MTWHGPWLGSSREAHARTRAQVDDSVGDEWCADTRPDEPGRLDTPALQRRRARDAK